MLIDLLFQDLFLCINCQFLRFWLHIEKHLVLLELNQFTWTDFSLLVKSLEHSVNTSLGYYKDLVIKFEIIEVKLEFWHHFLEQFKRLNALYHQAIEI